MDLNVNDKIHGFTVGRIRKVNDLDGYLVEMKHNQTGCELLYLMHEDENKTFAIAFKTIPHDDTGVFHILEHSVLNGSKKYPVKEPFVELLKSSLQTFLNAMTYADKTMYPVSSRNEKDFMNLMDVYLDAVFFPAVYTNKNIFLQEGWHYEVDEEKELSYKGVVHSEMQGAFSSVDEVLMNHLAKMLFKDTCYQYESGGDPAAITDLTYEQFLDAHRTFYHPSNARIVLDGSINLDKTLEKIDSYLSQFEAKEMNFDIPMQEVLPREDQTCFYQIGPEEEETNKTHIAFSKIVCDYSAVETTIAWEALDDLLAGSNEAPLKQAILEKGLGQDVDVDIITGIQQAYVVVTVRNTEESKREEIRRVITDTVLKILEEGVNTDRIIASLNMMEFKYREKSEPAGVINADSALKSWLYGGDIANYLDCGNLYEVLREKVKKGYFEKLLRDFFLDHEHVSSLAVVPSKTFEKEMKEKEEAKLKQKKVELGSHLDEIEKECEALLKWQNTPDSKQALDTLPKLNLEDVPELPTKFEPEVVESKGVPYLIYPEQTKDVVYFTLYFNLAGLKKEQLSAVSFYSSLLGSLSTEHYNVEELAQEIRANLGSLAILTSVIPVYADHERAIPFLLVNCSVLKENYTKAFELIEEILFHTVFAKENVRPLLAQYVEGARQSLIMAGHAIALNAVTAQNSASAAASEYISGFQSMKWAYKFNKDFDTKFEDFAVDCNLFRNILFTSSRVTVSLTKEENKEEMENFIQRLPRGEFERCTVHFPLAPKRNLGIYIPAPVSYCALSAYAPIDDELRGSELVLSHIMTYEYLWNEIRVKGGAYGTGFLANYDQVLGSYSYRDPNPSGLIDALHHTKDFIENFVKHNQDLTTYIIGSLANSDPLQSPKSKLMAADRRYLAGITYEKRTANRKAALHTDVNTLLEDATRFHNALQEGTYCVVGNEEAIASCEIDSENIFKLEE